MIIDMHQHLVPYQSWSEGYRRHLLDVRPDYFGEFMERHGRPDQMDALLEGEGVEYAVIMAEDAPITTGLASSEHVASFCRQTRRMLAFASINPMTEANLRASLDRAVSEFGCRGLKLYPSYQYFYPNDRIVYPLYQRAAELGIPVTIHTGSSTFLGARIKYADPLHVDDVAVDFPDLTLLLAHAGRPFWYGQAAWLARHHENVHLDLAGLPPKNLLTYIPDLERLSSKAVFGTDWPGIPTSISENIAAFQSLPLSEEAKARILSTNARRILKLDGRA
jgi:predicted TIM-barrel fold metal-dependent hydrolase